MTKLFSGVIFKIINKISLSILILTIVGAVLVTLYVTNSAKNAGIKSIDEMVSTIEMYNKKPYDDTVKSTIEEFQEQKNRISFLSTLTEDVFDFIKSNMTDIALVIFAPSIATWITLNFFSIALLFPLKKMMCNELLMFQWLYSVLLLIAVGSLVLIWFVPRERGSDEVLNKFLTHPIFSLGAIGDHVVARGSFIADIDLPLLVHDSMIKCNKSEYACREIATSISKDGYIDSEENIFPIYRWKDDIITAYNIEGKCRWYLLTIDLNQKTVAMFSFKKPGADNKTDITGCDHVDKKPYRMLLVEGNKALSQHKDKPAVTNPVNLEFPDISYSQISEFNKHGGK